jgi:hypothetical protein
MQICNTCVSHLDRQVDREVRLWRSNGIRRGVIAQSKSAAQIHPPG